jgi:hypothetical protein
MNKMNRVVAILIIIVLTIFGILFFTMPHDSDEDLVGEVEVESVDLFMIKIENFKYIGDFDYCLLVSTSIFFEETDITFDYVRTVCYYGDYIVFDTPGAMYITNDKYIKLTGIMIDDIAGLGGVL